MRPTWKGSNQECISVIGYVGIVVPLLTCCKIRFVVDLQNKKKVFKIRQ